VKNQIHAAECAKRLRTNHAVRVGNEADQHALSPLPPEPYSQYR
jgi:hypothetical protein